MNMTTVAAQYGKRPAKFLELSGANEYMEALAQILNIRKSDIWISKRGKGGGTLQPPKMVVRFAQWLDVRFTVWCDLMIDYILQGNIQTSVVVPTEEAVAVALPLVA
ncbi:hypothetical protein GBK02_05455 [Dechloromonas sp. TW-R-39-2]|nr:hypothetical protein GBK02_05455 [Dechloromonas sp. TW-R-39-2]